MNYSAIIGMCGLIAAGCTPVQLAQKVGIASDAIDTYTQEQITYKREHRMLTRDTVKKAVSSMMSQADVLIRSGKYEEAIKIYNDALAFLENNKPFMGQVLLDAKQLELKLQELDSQLVKPQPAK